MCGEKHGTVSESMQNMRQPMPITKKAKLVLRNSWSKLRTASTCCGNYGEPGC
jgi:hypothetical protein